MDILTHKENGVLTINFNRPEKKNAITTTMYQVMADALNDAENDNEIRAILITGKPEIFTAGNDLEDFMKNAASLASGAGVPPVYQFMHALNNASKPVIAAVAGAAVGIGTTLLMHCDLIYLADNAKLSMPFTQLGLCPEFASSMIFQKIVGYQRAAEKLMFGEAFSAPEAYEMGFVNKVLPVEELLPYAHKQAAKLGMPGTHFMNATGLPDKDHYTTASDLATLAGALIRDFPAEYKRLYSVKEYTYNNITQPNRNRLLWLDANVDGMKTGHTETAGYCLISSAKHEATRLVSVVLGAATEAMRASESQKLLNYGFQFYESTLVYKQNQPINTLRVYKGQDKTVATSLAHDFYLSLPKGEYPRVKANMTSTQPLIAPIKAGQEIGKITFSFDGKIINEQKLVAAKAVDEAGFIGRIADSVRLLIQ